MRFETAPLNVAESYIKSEGLESLKTSSFHKVAIIEFNVEYLVILPDSVSRGITDELYDIFVQSLQKETKWNIVNKEIVANNEVYSNLKKRTIKRRISQINDRTTISYPASGLGILVSPPDRGSNNFALKLDKRFQEPAILEDLSVSATLKVHTLIGYSQKGENGRLIIIPSDEELATSTHVQVLIDVVKQSMSGDEEVISSTGDIFYEYKDHCSFSLAEPIASYEPFSVKAGSFDVEEFIFWTKEMFTIYAEMMSLEISRKL